MSSEKSSNQEPPKVISLEEVQEHNKKSSVWFVIHDRVYDVTHFLDEHPGGEEVLLEQAGKDASEIFEDVSHSSDARELMKTYEIGVLHEKDHAKTAKVTKKSIKKMDEKGSRYDNNKSWFSYQWLFSLTVAGGIMVLYRFYAH